MLWRTAQQRRRGTGEQTSFLVLLVAAVLLTSPHLAQARDKLRHDDAAAAVETCPNRPFEALTLQSLADGTCRDGESAKLPQEATLPSADAYENRAPADDQPPTTVNATSQLANTTEAEARAEDVTTSTTSSVAQTASPAVHQPTKGDVWTDIDESLNGWSWTPELEQEYAKARDALQEEQNQGVAESANPRAPVQAESIHSKDAATGAEQTFPELPSFEEWKARQLAASLNQALDIGKKDSSSPRKGASTGEAPSRPINGQSGGSDVGQASTGLPGESNMEEADSVWGLAGDGALNALSADTERVLHPIPHSGTNDPLLDPLISLRDRTNYASFDCSATLIRSSKKTKSASAILSSKKDRYMLTPCAEKEKFVIVELCDEIQIDTVVLANLEFFSSMFKLFRVSGTTAHPESTKKWQALGTFRASNARGLQVFRPHDPASGGFYRYIRIDFITHYGTEYYCPVSLLKVYGLTQLDAYRRDQERQDKLAAGDVQDLLEEVVGQPELVMDETVFLQLVEPTAAHEHTGEEETKTASSEASKLQESSSPTSSTATQAQESTAASTSSGFPSGVPPTASAGTAAAAMASSSAITTVAEPSVASPAPANAQNSPSERRLTTKQSRPAPSETSQSSTSSTMATNGTSFSVPAMETSSQSKALNATATPWVTSVSSSVSGGPPLQSSAPRSTIPASSSTLSPNTLVYRTVSSGVPQAVQPVPARRNDSRPQAVYAHAHANSAQPNESIYGTIMKRLLALEVNATLSTAYVEEHTRMVRDAFHRIEQRLSDTEKSRAKYDQLLRRVMLDLDLHRARSEAERLEIMAQLNVLSREIVTERRLGIAQLLAMVILLFFVILTRGSPSSPVLSLANPLSAPSSASVFPKIVKTRRPRSLRNEPFDDPPSVDFRTQQPLRERRGLGSDKKSGPPFNLPLSAITRNGSVKRPYRTSNNIGRRPLSAVPLQRGGSDPASPMARLAPVRVEGVSETGLRTHVNGMVSESEAEGTPYPAKVAIEMPRSAKEASTTNLTIRSATPPLQALAPKYRRSPVDALRQKLRLGQPRRAASLDGSGLPGQQVSLSEQDSTPVAPDRKKRFTFGSMSPARIRANTFGSATDEDGDGNSKAWLSTSEDSADDGEGLAFTGVGVSSFSQLVNGHPSRLTPHEPPTPDPSDVDSAMPYDRYDGVRTPSDVREPPYSVQSSPEK